MTGGVRVNPASIAAFKSKTLALIETLHLPDNVVVAIGITLAVSHGLTAGINRAALHDVLDKSVNDALANPVTGAAND